MEIKEIAQEFLEGKGTISMLSQKYKVSKQEIKVELESQGFIIKQGYKLQTILGLKYGVEEYIQNIDNNPSLTKICAKYGMNRKTLSDRLRDLGYEVINHQNKSKFNENVFDSIDTEEKAYWLGFIYADGTISSDPLKKGKKKSYTFELSLKESDSNHLEKLKELLGTPRPILKSENRCRLLVNSKHFWETLNNYGCTPRKSLTLEFPNIEIFKSPDLIRHFIRGYFDGDGCISYNNKSHTVMALSVLGTENFLTGIKNNLPVKFDYQLGHNNKSDITRILAINGKNGLEILFYLYENSTIYLHRKFEKYQEFCRLYEKLYRELQTNIGESCDANTEIITETKKSVAS